MVFYFCLNEVVAESCEASCESRRRMDKASGDHTTIVKTSQS